MATQPVVPVVQDQTVAHVLSNPFVGLAAAAIQAAQQDVTLLSGPDKKNAVIQSMADAAAIVAQAVPSQSLNASLALAAAIALIDPLVALFHKFKLFHHAAPAAPAA